MALKRKIPSKINKFKLALQLSPIILVVIITLIGVTQLDVVREFFSKASGEEANIVIDTQAVIRPVEKPWRYLAQGGEAFDWDMGPIVPKVKALNPEYIRIDHIYDFFDIVQNNGGNLSFNFTKLDAVLDDIEATGAKPFIALSYMPQSISSGDIVSEPTNWNHWQQTVQKTIEHVSGTRGTTDVYYEVWNEPDLFGGWKTYGSKNYLTLYSYAAQGAAQAKGVKPIKFGGPGITALYKNWFNNVSKHAMENNLRYDFFSWHRYNYEIDQFKEDFLEAQTWRSQYPQLENLELIITEWGHDPEVQAGYDTSFGAAHTVAAAIEMVGEVDKAFVFEIEDGKSAEGKSHWGRWGLLTHQEHGAQPKPRYNALKMLDQIDGNRLQLLGKGSWVKALATKTNDETVQVVLANYDRNGAHSESVPLTFENITPGEYTFTQTFLGGRSKTDTVATTSAKLQTNVYMLPNSVAFTELKPNFAVQTQQNITPSSLEESLPTTPVQQQNQQAPSTTVQQSPDEPPVLPIQGQPQSPAQPPIQPPAPEPPVLPIQ